MDDPPKPWPRWASKHKRWPFPEKNIFTQFWELVNSGTKARTYGVFLNYYIFKKPEKKFTAHAFKLQSSIDQKLKNETETKICCDFKKYLATKCWAWPISAIYIPIPTFKFMCVVHVTSHFKKGYDQSLSRDVGIERVRITHHSKMPKDG